VAIEVFDKQKLVRIKKSAVADLAGATLALVKKQTSKPLADWQVSIVFVRDKKIRQLNRQYRGKDYATDVLSFQASDDAQDAFDFGEENYLGDIVIATDTALRQAEEAKQTFAREVQELVIHGLLHLCGYDHETDNGEMNRLELRLRKKLLD
jgi:probable rRNA maturation factor